MSALKAGASFVASEVSHQVSSPLTLAGSAAPVVVVDEPAALFAGVAAELQAARDLGDRADVLRHVLTGLAIATSRGLHQRRLVRRQDFSQVLAVICKTLPWIVTSP